jgi:hypothetical protein
VKVDGCADIVGERTLDTPGDHRSWTGNFDELGHPHLPAARTALLPVCIPIAITKRQPLENSRALLRPGIPKLLDRFDLLVVDACKILRVHLYQDIRLLHALQFVHRDDYADRALEHAERGEPIVGLEGGRLQMHCDHDIGAHGSSHVDGKVLNQATVDKHMVVAPDRTEDRRHGHGGSQSLPQRAVIEHGRFSRNQIRGHTAEGGRQIIEAFEIGIRQRHLVENQPNLVA